MYRILLTGLLMAAPTMAVAEQTHSTTSQNGMTVTVTVTMDPSAMNHTGMGQSSMDHATMGQSGMNHTGMGQSDMDHTAMNQPAAQPSDMDHSAMTGGPGGAPVTEPGQGAFAAIAEIVATLNADPNTDWSTVNIDALREHLRDMDIVTIDSYATVETINGGLKFVVTGPENVSPSIERMVVAHASVMDGVDDWNYSAEIISNGAALTVSVPEADLPKLQALGFYGLLAGGMHHQTHHWMMATGSNPHN